MLIFVLFLALAVYCFTLEIVETMERRRSARERERMAELQEEFVGAASRDGADAAAAGGGCEYCRNSRVSRNRILQQRNQVVAGAGGGLRWIS